MRDARAVVGVVVALVAMTGAVAPVAAGTGGIDAGIDASGVADDAAGVDASAQSACEFPFTATDATGTEVTVEDAPERVVTLAPSAAQTMWELNASETVVGLTDNALYLDGADEREIVAQEGAVQNELVIGLEPDVVLAPNVITNETVEALRSNGLTVYRFEETGDFEGIYRKTELIGQLTGECEAAESTVTDMQDRVDAITEAVSDEPRPGGMYVFYGFTAGEDTFIDAIIETAGVRNVAAEIGITRYREVNDEVIVNQSANIEWLILNSDPTSHPSSDVYNGTAALRNNQTVVLNKDYLNQPAPRTVRAVEALTQAVHPEAYEEAQAALTSTPAPTDTESTGTTTDAMGTTTPDGMTDTATSGGMDGTSTEGMDATGETDAPAPETTTDASGPGFTAGVALVALLAAVLVGRRRR